MTQIHPDQNPVAAPTARRGVFIRLALLLIIFAAAGYAAHRAGFFALRDPDRLAEAIRNVRGTPFLPVLFVLAYALASIVGLPAALFTLAGGAIFGLAVGSLLNWCGAVIGAIGAYVLGRYFGSDAIRSLLGRHARALDALTARAGFATVFRLRLIPVVPFNVLNYASGLAPVPFRAYALATSLGILPATIIYTYFADSLLAGASGARNEALLQVAIAGALLVAISFGPALVRKVRDW